MLRWLTGRKSSPGSLVLASKLAAEPQTPVAWGGETETARAKGYEKPTGKERGRQKTWPTEREKARVMEAEFSVSPWVRQGASALARGGESQRAPRLFQRPEWA